MSNDRFLDVTDWHLGSAAVRGVSPDGLRVVHLLVLKSDKTIWRVSDRKAYRHLYTKHVREAAKCLTKLEYLSDPDSEWKPLNVRSTAA